MSGHAKRLLGGLALLGFAVGILAPYAWSRYHLRAAERALQQYDLIAARAHLRQSLAWLPGNARILFLQAQTARRLDDCAKAEKLLLDYQHRQGITEEGRLEWLLLGVQQGDLGGHVRELQSLVDAEHPAASLILEALAKGFMNVARGPEMLTCLNRLLQCEPLNTPALTLRGKGWEELHNPERAVQDYQRAVDVDPECYAARLGLANTLQQLGRVREASAHYEILRQQRPRNPDVLLGLARCRFDSYELDQAAELLDLVLASHPDHVAALVERGRLALCRHDEGEAEARLLRATALAPWHREAHRLLLSCLQTLGKSAEAEKCRARIRELQASDSQEGIISRRFLMTPQDPSVRFDLARWSLQNGREHDGIRWLFRTLLVDPRYGPAHAALADYFQRSGQPRRSAEQRTIAGGTQPHFLFETP
jgi:tetratricopeptide (TPR) repeat protein